MTPWTSDPGNFPPSAGGDADPWFGQGAPVPPSAPPTAPPTYPPTASLPLQRPLAPPPAGPPLRGSFQTPPPPLYPPIDEFRTGDAAGPRSGRSRGRSGRRAMLVLASVIAGLLVAGAGYGVGSQFAGDDNANPPSRTISAPLSPSKADPAATASSLPGQDGPITKAPTLDPGLMASEPAAAVNRAVSPAVVQIETSSGLGTGFIYDGQGYILTAAHVVATSNGQGTFGSGFDKDVTVQLADGAKVPGTVLGSDLNNDVAVVKIDPVKNMPVVALALGEKIEVGTTAIAIGSPFGLDQTVTQGIISATNRPVPSPNNNLVNMIQTDAAINSGNSGGPLVNRQGKVIGINTQIRTDSGDNAGIGFAVPIDLAYDVAQSLVAGKPVKLGYLGMRGQDPASGRTGAMVAQVEAGSPAEKGGLQVGDLVTTADGDVIRSFEQLASIIRATKPGDKLELVVVRSGATVKLTVVVGEATTR